MPQLSYAQSQSKMCYTPVQAKLALLLVLTIVPTYLYNFQSTHEQIYSKENLGLLKPNLFWPYFFAEPFTTT